MDFTPGTAGVVDRTPMANRDSTTGGSRKHAFLFDDLRRAADTLNRKYFHDYHYDMTYPKPMLSSFTYLHPAVRDVFEMRPVSEQGLAKTEADAMALHMLDQTNYDYLMMWPEDSKMMYRHAAESHDVYVTDRAERMARGEVVPALDDPQKKNPLLDDADAELLNMDLEENPLNQKSLPTLQLLKKPIYTELGQTSREERKEARFSRAAEGLSQSFNEDGRQSSLSLGTPLGRQSMASFGRASGVEMDTHRKSGVPQTDGDWASQVKIAFKRAKALDVQYHRLVDAIAAQKLGLVEPAHVESTVPVLLSLMAYVTGNKLRAVIWRVVMEAARTNGPVAATAFASLEAALEENASIRGGITSQTLEGFRTWFVDFSATCASIKDEKKRLGLLKHEEADRMVPTREDVPFSLEFAEKPKEYTLQHPTKSNIVPLSVKPLFPSGADADPNLTKQEYYGNDGESLEHYVFSNTRPHTHTTLQSTQEREGGAFVPYFAVDGKMVYRPAAKQPSTPDTSATTTMLYESLAEEFKAARTLEVARSTYVLHSYDDRVEYSRVGKRVIHDHKPISAQNKLKSKRNHVLVVVGDDEPEEMGNGTADRKRTRESENESA